MLSLFEHKKKSLESGVTAAVKGELPLTKEQEDALFKPAKYDPNAAEKTGYSNYSYWRSTLNAFFHTPVAVIMLAVLVLLLAFTIIQPHLPGQYEANTVYNDPVTGMQLQNQAPSTTTVYATVPDGTALPAPTSVCAGSSAVDSCWPREVPGTVLTFEIQYSEHIKRDPEPVLQEAGGCWQASSHWSLARGTSGKVF